MITPSRGEWSHSNGIQFGPIAGQLSLALPSDQGFDRALGVLGDFTGGQLELGENQARDPGRKHREKTDRSTGGRYARAAGRHPSYRAVADGNESGRFEGGEAYVCERETRSVLDRNPDLERIAGANDSPIGPSLDLDDAVAILRSP